jgi:Protein of unknown function (DUF998)
MTRWLLRCGVWAGPAFTAAFLAEGAAREDYRPQRHPVSSLALGPRGWVQTANFVVTGAAFLAGAAGLCLAGDRVAGDRVAGDRVAGDRVAGGRAGPALVAAAGAGLIAAAVFPTDPVRGYPPGTPDVLTAPSRVGTAHNLAAVPVFFGLPAAAAAYGWRSWRAGERTGFAACCAVTAVAMPAAMVLAAAGFGQSDRLADYGGLFQRASIVTGFGWLTAVSARALRRMPAGHPR